MDDRLRHEPDREVVPEPVADRLLARAGELDAAERAGVDVARLRAAAAEAGIATRAFDTALAELREAAQPPAAVASQPRWRRRIWTSIIAVAALLVSELVVSQVRSPASPPAAANTIEKAFLLRCLSPGEAAELIRPLLDQRSTVVHHLNAPRVLTVRASPEQMQSVGAALDLHDGAGSPACASPAPAATH